MLEKEMLVQLTRIADALEQLAPGAIENASTVANEVVEQVEPVAKKAPKEEAKKAYTHDDLKDTLMAAVKSDINNKPKLKAFLAKYDAKKAVDVPLEKLDEVIGLIVTGDY